MTINKSKVLDFITGFLAITIVVSITSCSSKKEEIELPNNIQLPQWALQPELDDGIASASCVKFSGNISLDQQEITAKGRAALAQQISLRAQVMDKTYQEKVETADKSASGNVFESVSKQLTDQELVGSKLIRTEFGTVNDDQYMCGMVGITPEETKKIFAAIVESPNAPKTSRQDQDLLYEEFKAYKAHQDLDQALGNVN